MQPLSNTTRNGTLLIAIAIFVLGAPLLIAYSQGYRLGSALSIIKTGGIYVHSEVANSDVYLDGKFLERNGAFLRNTLVQDLLPNKTYSVRVVKEGYHDWRKDLVILPNLVTEARVLMLPVAFEWRSVPASTTVPMSERGTTTASTTVANPEYIDLAELFEASNDQFAVEVATSTLIVVKGRAVATTTTVIEIQLPEWLEETASSSSFIGKEMIREREGVVGWLDGGNLVVQWVRERDAPPYYFCMKTCRDTISINWQEPIQRYEFYPNRSDVVVIGTERGIFAIELDNRSQPNIQPILVGPGLDFRIENSGDIVVFDGSEFKIARL